MVELDPDQKEAVEAPDGRILVVASAGSGKTRVLTERVARLIEKGTAPSSILAVTFTNKAAEEMKERLKPRIGRAAEKLWVGTFHSMCHRILRLESSSLDFLGYKRGFTIIDDDEAESIMKEVLEDLESNCKPKEILNDLSYYRLTLRDLGEIDDELVKKAAPVYRERLLEMNVMDFDDLLINALELLRASEEVRMKYAERFEHVLIDEFQDIDPCQWEIMKLLTSVHGNLFAVGDFDQAVYSFRGGAVDIIMEYMRDPGTKVYVLKRNYRSTANIVAAADSVIKNNSNRPPKTQVPVKGEGEAIGLYVAPDDHDEAVYVASAIKELIGEGVIPGEIAALTRTSFQFGLLDRALSRMGVPHKVVGRTGLLDRAVVKTITAFLRFAVNRKDIPAFRRALMTVKGVGPRTIAKVAVLAESMPVEELIQDRKLKLNATVRQGLMNFADAIRKISGMKPFEAVEFILGLGWLKLEGDERQVVQEFLKLASDFEAEAPNPSLEEFVGFVMSLSSDSSKGANGNGDQDAVKIMTMHAAKGKEFDYVFLPGLEEGGIPHYNAQDVEEERRLMYVAITRARKKLYLSYARERSIGGWPMKRMPSRFLAEIDGKLVRLVNGKSREVSWKAEELAI